MGIKGDFQQINQQFKRVTRVDREQILCAMIRVNYGTPWSGDLDRLKAFLPVSYHSQLNFSGLTDLIEGLSPFADEPTIVSLPDDEITLNDATSLLNQVEATSTMTQFTRELDAEAADHTHTIKIPA